jgi:hypothetical protein
MMRPRLHRDSRHHHGSRDDGETVEIDIAELSGVFAAPSWLRDAGLTAWLLVGVTCSWAVRSGSSRSHR